MPTGTGISSSAWQVSEAQAEAWTEDTCASCLPSFTRVDARFGSVSELTNWLLAVEPTDPTLLWTMPEIWVKLGHGAAGRL